MTHTVSADSLYGLRMRYNDALEVDEKRFIYISCISCNLHGQPNVSRVLPG